MPPVAIAVEQSGNGKLGAFSATYASIAFTCPTTCEYYPQAHPTRGNTLKGQKFDCYGLFGNSRMHVTRLNSGDASDAIDAAHQEAAAIGKLTGENVLRLHVFGDCATTESAQIVSGACADYSAKHNQPAFTYTHGWRDVHASAWGNVKVRASLQTEEDIPLALAQGYKAVALVYTTPDHKPLVKPFMMGGTKIVPCPEQSGKAPNCMACGLCFRTDVSIGFIGHDGISNGQTQRGPLPVIEVS